MGVIRFLAATVFGLAVGHQASVAEAAPASWTCDALTYDDGVCDCGCGAADTDCGAGSFVVCERSGCPANTVPWEHSPSQCMRSACGDGWRDEAAGEICDDAEALAGGGCNADCSAINPGWSCGDRGAQCVREDIAADQGVDAPDQGELDASQAIDSGVGVDAVLVDMAGTRPTTDGAVVEADQGDQSALPGGDEKSSDGGCSAAAAQAPPADSLLAFTFGLLGLVSRRRRHA